MNPPTVVKIVTVDANDDDYLSDDESIMNEVKEAGISLYYSVNRKPVKKDMVRLREDVYYDRIVVQLGELLTGDPDDELFEAFDILRRMRGSNQVEWKVPSLILKKIAVVLEKYKDENQEILKALIVDVLVKYLDKTIKHPLFRDYIADMVRVMPSYNKYWYQALEPYNNVN